MDPDLSIVLLGNSGVGKSASGNTILGRTAFESKRSFRSVTTEICEQSGTVFGKQISVVDTPGILGSERKIWTWCQENLQSSRPRLFLIVVKIDRFTIEQNNAVEAVLRVIGDTESNNCYLLFTGGDDLNDMTLDDFINEDPGGPLKHLAESFGQRLHLFNNQDRGPEQVRELLVKSGHLRQDDHPEERRIVLLGLPGDGKSSSGNTILRSDQFQSGCDFNSVSREAVSKSATVEGHQVTVVDTPGVTAKVLTPRKLFNEIMESVGTEPHAFIIVVKIGRICEANIKLFKILEKLFGRDARKYMMVLFTHGDQLKRQCINDLIQKNNDVQKLVSRCANRYCVFDNSRRGNRAQVRDLLDKIDMMVTDNNGDHYTSEMFFKRQSLPVKISIKWHELGEWFTRQIRSLDACHRYERFDMDDDRQEEAAGSGAAGDSVPLLPMSSKKDE